MIIACWNSKPFSFEVVFISWNGKFYFWGFGLASIISRMISDRKPDLKGFNSRIIFSKKQCGKLKISEAFADVAVKDWCNEKLMAKNFVMTLGPKSNYQDALQQIKYSLNVLSMKQKFLDGYCDNAIDYFKATNVASSFKDTYNKELEELKIQQLKSMSSRKGYRNAIAVTVEEHDRYYQEIVDFTPEDFNTTQEAADFKPEDSNINQETAEFTPEDTLTAQKIADSTDPSTAPSFRTEVFKAGYKYVSICYSYILTCSLNSFF